MAAILLKGGKKWIGGAFTENRELILADRAGEDRTLQLRDDDLILPGIIDFHTHLWAPPSLGEFGVRPERFAEDGIIAAVDCGTYGIDSFEAADRWFSTCPLEVRSFIHLLPEGISGFPLKTATPPEKIDVPALAKFLRGHVNRALGVKVHLGWLPYKSEATDRALLHLAVQAAELSSTRVMVHISGQCISARETAQMLRPGDIVTHPFSGQEHTILDQNGRVFEEVLAARERGVLFDMGYGGYHFKWDVFFRAREQGMRFDTLGCDFFILSYKTPRSFLRDEFHILSGLLGAGVPENEVFAALTDTPAKLMGISLSFERCCLVLRKEYGKTVASDGQGTEIPLSFEYRPFFVSRQAR